MTLTIILNGLNKDMDKDYIIWTEEDEELVQDLFPRLASHYIFYDKERDEPKDDLFLPKDWCGLEGDYWS